MGNFIERWKKEPKFKAKIKLFLYTLFVVFVSIFALSNRPTDLEENNLIEDTGIQETVDNTIKIPTKYNYTSNITINENKYIYSETNNNDITIIKKQIGENIINYKVENNSYYKEQELNYILITKEEVYDVVDETYLNLETINKYLKKSQKQEDKYIVYLKDIILGNNSDDYITITKENNKINIDYTKLIQNFDPSIEKYIVDIEIEEIE